jgi:hypothetical protein
VYPFWGYTEGCRMSHGLIACSVIMVTVAAPETNHCRYSLLQPPTESLIVNPTQRPSHKSTTPTHPPQFPFHSISFSLPNTPSTKHTKHTKHHGPVQRRMGLVRVRLVSREGKLGATTVSPPHLSDPRDTTPKAGSVRTCAHGERSQAK